MPKRILPALRVRMLHEPWMAEFWSALVATSWALLTYYTPGDMTRWQTMRVLLELAPEEFWTTAPIILGTLQMAALMIDWRPGRWLATVLMAWFWSVVALGVWHGVPWAPTVVFVAGWGGVNAFSVLRLLHRDTA